MNTNPLWIALGTACIAAWASGCGEEPESTSQAESALSGAVFTTTVNGDRVNANIYPSKSAVYLDGGPGDGAPSGSAALPEGDYYFMVTSPSGHTLLSSDSILCRRFHVNDDGVVDVSYPGPGCQHATGVDQDHAALGAITIQLMPYDDTPNNGGEYKMWVTSVDDYSPGHGKFGFIPRYSKTDNYKVREPEEEPPCCGDGHLDEGEDCDDGNTTNGDGCSSECTIEPPPPCCGDGHVDAGEACDDGNTTNGDGCSSECTIEPPPPCCGDGNVDAGEACDDGNNTNGDGCSAECTIEPPPPCCGDGQVDAGEECDDGNTTDGDGCSSSCTLESECLVIEGASPYDCIRLR